MKIYKKAYEEDIDALDFDIIDTKEEKKEEVKQERTYNIVIQLNKKTNTIQLTTFGNCLELLDTKKVEIKKEKEENEENEENNTSVSSESEDAQEVNRELITIFANYVDANLISQKPTTEGWKAKEIYKYYIDHFMFENEETKKTVLEKIKKENPEYLYIFTDRIMQELTNFSLQENSLSYLILYKNFEEYISKDKDIDYYKKRYTEFFNLIFHPGEFNLSRFKICNLSKYQLSLFANDIKNDEKAIEKIEDEVSNLLSISTQNKTKLITFLDNLKELGISLNMEKIKDKQYEIFKNNIYNDLENILLHNLAFFNESLIEFKNRILNDQRMINIFKCKCKEYFSQGSSDFYDLLNSKLNYVMEKYKNEIMEDSYSWAREHAKTYLLSRRFDKYEKLDKLFSGKLKVEYRKLLEESIIDAKEAAMDMLKMGALKEFLQLNTIYEQELVKDQNIINYMHKNFNAAIEYVRKLLKEGKIEEATYINELYNGKIFENDEFKI